MRHTLLFLIVVIWPIASQYQVLAKSSHTIDRTIWPASVERVGQATLLLTLNDAAQHSDCLLKEATTFFQKTEHAIALGESCGLMVVAGKFETTLSELEREFFLAHESFHLLVQMTSGTLAVEYFFVQRPEQGSADYEIAGKFFLDILSYRDICKAIELNRSALTLSVMKYVSNITIFEWPAEYYAYKYINTRHATSPEDYASIRRRFGEFAEYSSGVLVGEWLDEGAPWKDQVYAGESMLDIAAARCNTNWPMEKRLLGKVVSMRAFSSR
jgi:hypothetical protein